nr:hypothetical protein [Tanacetum cinerariifolium]
PLAFADAPSHPPVDVAQSSQGVVVAEDPGSKNASSPIEVLSPGSKSVAQVARREKRIQDRELEIKNLEVLLETEAEMKRAAEEQVSGEEKLKAAFEEFKRYEDDRVEKRWKD